MSYLESLGLALLDADLKSFDPVLEAVYGMSSTSTPEEDLVNSNDLAHNGTPTLEEEGPSGSAIYLDASGDFLQRTTTGMGHSTTQSWSAGGWFKIEEDIPNSTLFSWGSATANAIALSIDAGNALEFYERGSGSVRSNFDSMAPLPVNNGEFWHAFVTYHKTLSAYTLYFNGMPVGASFGNGNARHDAASSQFQIGCLNGNVQYFKGWLGEFRYYKGDDDTACLSPKAVRQLARGKFYS